MVKETRLGRHIQKQHKISPSADAPKQPTLPMLPPRDLDTLSGVEFEKLIARLLACMGFHAQMTKASGDGGIDIVATLDRPIVGGRYLIQCKRYAPCSPVGVPRVREFYGALATERAVKGVLISTSGFTADAKRYASEVSIDLIGRYQLERLLAEWQPTAGFPADDSGAEDDVLVSYSKVSADSDEHPQPVAPSEPHPSGHRPLSFPGIDPREELVSMSFPSWATGELLLSGSKTYLRRGYTKAALLTLEEAAKRSPDDLEVWWYLALARKLLSRNAEAVAALREAVRIDPSHAESWDELRLLYRSLGDSTAAQEAQSRLEDLIKRPQSSRPLA